MGPFGRSSYCARPLSFMFVVCNREFRGGPFSPQRQLLCSEHETLFSRIIGGVIPDLFPPLVSPLKPFATPLRRRCSLMNGIPVYVVQHIEMLLFSIHVSRTTALLWGDHGILNSNAHVRKQSCDPPSPAHRSFRVTMGSLNSNVHAREQS